MVKFAISPHKLYYKNKGGNMNKEMIERIQSMTKSQHIMIPWKNMNCDLLEWYTLLHEIYGLSSCNSNSEGGIFRKDHYRFGDENHGNNSQYLERKQSDKKRFLVEVLEEIEAHK